MYFVKLFFLECNILEAGSVAFSLGLSENCPFGGSFEVVGEAEEGADFDELGGHTRQPKSEFGRPVVQGEGVVEVVPTFTYGHQTHQRIFCRPNRPEMKSVII